MAASMSRECVEFIDKEFHNDKKLKILPLGIQRATCFSFHSASSEEHVQACDEVLSAIEEYQSTATGQVVPQDILLAKCEAHMQKGNIFKKQNDPVCAIRHLEESKEVFLQMGCSSDGISVLEVDTLIARGKVNLTGADKKIELEKLLQHQKHIHTVTKAEYGDDDYYTLSRGVDLVFILLEMEQVDEAIPLLQSFYRRARQVHDPSHPKFQHIKRVLKDIVNRLELA